MSDAEASEMFLRSRNQKEASEAEINPSEENKEKLENPLTETQTPAFCANKQDLTANSGKDTDSIADSGKTLLNRDNAQINNTLESNHTPTITLERDKDGWAIPKSESNIRDEKFVDLIAKGHTQSEAYRLAGFNDNGNASVCASNKLRKVTDLLAERRAYFRSIANIEAEDIIGAQTEIAFGHFENAFDEDGNYDHAKAVETGAFRLIKKVSTTYTKMGKTVNVEAYSRADALSALAEMLGLKKAPALNNARTRLLDAIEKVMRVENLTFPQAYEYIAKRNSEGDVQLFSPELMKQVAEERGIEVQQLEGTN